MKKDPGKLQNVPLSLVCVDGTQCRVETYDLAEMAAEIREEGRVRQPIAVFYDGNRYWVGDGHHRMGAARLAGLDKIHALVRRGGKREAVLYAVGANAEHGHRRTNADKRNAVLVLLRDKEWAKWSDRKISTQARVDHKSVASWRKEYLGNSPDKNVRKVQRGGTVYEQDTSNIGKRSASDSTEAPWQQSELPGTARAQAAAPTRPRKPDPDDLFVDPGSDVPEDQLEVLEEVTAVSGKRDVQRDETARSFNGTLDEQATSSRIIARCQSFGQEMQALLAVSNPRHMRDDILKKGCENAIISLVKVLAEAMPTEFGNSGPDRWQPKIISGGKS